MTVLRHNWYNLNAQRAYPLDDAATHVTDDGRRLPADILVDCHIRFPSVLGEYLFVSAVTVTDRLVTLTFLASDTPAAAIAGSSASGGTFTPVAAVSLVKPLDTFRHYAVQALYHGVGGWLVLGDGIGSNFTGRFSSVEQGMLAPRCARSYRALPVSDIAKQHTSARLTGLVQLKAGADIFIEKQVVDLGDRTVDAAVIGLRTTPERNVFDLYKGTCGGRPETGTCFRPGIVSINSVTPDCDGNIQLYVEGLELGTLSGGAGLVLDAGLGVTDVCTQADRLPDANGKLPTDYEDLCNPDGLPPGSGSASESDGEDSSVSLSSISLNCSELPYSTNFDTGIDSAWVTKIGTFELTEDDSPDEHAGESSSSLVVTPSSVGVSEAVGLLSCVSVTANFTVHRPGQDYITVGVESGDWTNVREKVFVGGAQGDNELVVIHSPVAYAPGLYSAYLDNTAELLNRMLPRVRLYARVRMLDGAPTTLLFHLAMTQGSGTIYNNYVSIPLSASEDFEWIEAEFEGPLETTGEALFMVAALFVVHNRRVEVDVIYAEVDADDLNSSFSSSAEFNTESCIYTVVEQPVIVNTSAYDYVPIDRSLLATDRSRRNVMLWDDCSYTDSTNKRVITHLKLSPGLQRNGGLVLNYRLNSVGRPTYWYVSVNAATDALEIRYFNGTMFQPPAVAANALGIVLNAWYSLEVLITPDSGGTHIYARLLSVTAPTLDASIAFTTNNYNTDGGKFGLGTDRAETAFSHFRLLTS